MKKLSALLLLLLVQATPVAAMPITLERLDIEFRLNVGLAYQDTSGTLITSGNYPNGDPNNFQRLTPGSSALGTFSSASGFVDEVNLAIVPTGLGGGWVAGTVFSGTGDDGVIARISADGGTVTATWVSLPGPGNGLFRGELAFDRTGLWGNNLLAVTTTGQVWRIASDGTPTRIALIPGTQLSSVLAVPDEARYGGLAGKILAGSDTQNRIYIISADGTFTFITAPAGGVEDLQMIVAGANLYGVDYSGARFFGASASQFSPYVGDILLGVEFAPAGAADLHLLRWDATAGAAMITPLALATGSYDPRQLEKLVFSPIGLGSIAAVGGDAGNRIPEPGAAGLLLVAALAAAAARRRRDH